MFIISSRLYFFTNIDYNHLTIFPIVRSLPRNKKMSLGVVTDYILAAANI
jgi:hypothetical protein